MNFWDLIYIIPGAVTLSVMAANLLPFALDKKFNPLLMFLSALLCMFLPVPVVVALAVAVPMGFIYGWTGVRLQGHEPVKFPVDKLRGYLARFKPRARVPVQEVLTREYAAPEPGEGNVTKAVVPKYVPAL